MAITHDVPGRVGAAAPRRTPPGNGSVEVPARGGASPPAPSSSSLSNAHVVAPDSRRHGMLVGIILGTVVASALLMATFIWYRWQAIVEPTTAVIVEGDAALDGTVVTVTGPQVFTARLSASNNYAAPVLLEPGRYWVTAEHGGRVLLHHEVEVERFLGVRINLADYASDPPAAAAATPPTSPGHP